MEEVSMGAYGVYVWTCFGMTAAVLVFCEWRARQRHRRVCRDIEVRIKALGETE